MRAIELIAESNIMDISLHDVPYILPHKKEALSTVGLVVHHNSRQVAYYDLFQRLGGVSSIDIYIRYMVSVSSCPPKNVGCIALTLLIDNFNNYNFSVCD